MSRNGLDPDTLRAFCVELQKLAGISTATKVVAGLGAGAVGYGAIKGGVKGVKEQRMMGPLPGTTNLPILP